MQSGSDACRRTDVTLLTILGTNVQASGAVRYCREPSDGRARIQRLTGRGGDRRIRRGLKNKQIIFMERHARVKLRITTDLRVFVIFLEQMGFFMFIDKVRLGLLNQPYVDLILEMDH